MSINKLLQKGLAYNDFISRTKKNQKRFQEVYSKVRLTEKEIEYIQDLNIPIKILIIAENWCSDSFHVLPILKKFGEYNDLIQLIIVPRDDVLDIFEEKYLTGGKAKIPFILFLNDRDEEVHRWIERTNDTYEKINELKSKNMEKADFYKKVLSIFLNEKTVNNNARDLFNVLKRAILIAKASQ